MTEAEIRKLQAQYPTENDPMPFARALIDHIEHLGMVTDQEILDLAHRTASKYAHRSDPTFIAYTFLPHTLIDFARKLLSKETK